MTIRLEIIGQDAAELLHHLAGLVSSLQQSGAEWPDTNREGYAPLLKDAEARQRGENVDGTERRETVEVAETVPTGMSDATPPKKRGRPAKPTVTIEAVAEAVVSEAAVPITETKAEPVTIDGIRQRTMEIIAAHKDRGNDMATVTGYVMQLFKPFGIKKAAELAPEKWEEFMTASQAYVDGTAVAA